MTVASRCLIVTSSKTNNTQGMAAMTTYVIIDIQTKAQVGKVYTERKRASAQANRPDMKYGAIRYVVKSIYADEAN
ncbi:hypothetical protein [Robertmurraya sp.]|uniref:hypothetical protein n=1 Tax=Robertmurraya sp. TaxID=2837525 RepID=UPI00370450C0